VSSQPGPPTPVLLVHEVGSSLQWVVRERVARSSDIRQVFDLLITESSSRGRQSRRGTQTALMGLI
jgi:hypothetical protein